MSEPKGKPMGRGRGRGRTPQTAEKGAESPQKGPVQAPAAWSRPSQPPSAAAPPPSSGPSGPVQQVPRGPPSAWGRASHRATPAPEQPIPPVSAKSSVVPVGTSSASGGEVVGRGGMRGGRRLNEAECLLTKPAQCATKKGTYGTKIELQSNYFQMITKNWCLYQYRVDFSPEEDRTFVRKGLLRIHHETIGAYIFDGTVLFTSSRLPEGMELFSMRQSDQEKIRISLRMVGELQKGDHHYIQFFNIVMRKCLDNLKLQLVGRNFYDPANKIQIHGVDVPIQIWPGYVTSIRQCEYSILMCAEISHKVMQDRTVLHLLGAIYDSYRDFRKHFSAAILGQVVLTVYNNNTYRIDDVDYSVTPNSTFKLRNGESISYIDYYKSRYGINVTNITQPMLVSRSKPKDRRAGEAELIYLMPELCRLTGITDEMRASFKTMGALAEHTKLEPRTRIKRLLSFNQRLLSEPKIAKELTDWGLKLDNKLVSVSARVIPRDKILLGDSVFVTPQGNWDNELRSKKMFIIADLKDWVILVTKRNKLEAKELLSSLKKVAAGMHFHIAEPRFYEIDYDRSSAYTEALEMIMSQTNPQMIMCIVTNNDLDRYSAIKKKCCVDRPVLSQVVIRRTIMSKGKPNLTAATKIAIQMNTKLGGAPWTVEIPQGNFMVAGFDVCHDKTTKGRDFGALVASLDKNFTRYFSAVSAHTSGEELSNDLSVNMCKAVAKYRELNKVLPSTIIFYRDGVGEGQVPFVYEIEVEELKNKLLGLYGDVSKLKLIFLIVTKQINTRFFYNGSNAPAGTIVDDVITNPSRFDFYLVSQSGGKGTITPSGYNVIFDSSGWGPDKIQRMTYKLTQMYFNFTGAVKVPAPCQYAHKLAALVAQAIQKPPSIQLETLLYYL
ncbi:piwi-like protein Siwi [Belonocnema kinseyi]|uniref:piwi-like protein Siwi n=1 Tax=Belonocnema kinseyi TaxID=2817044 RepID=UPI00143DD174|nr:piwi-like protein Siwi [Belonocnema kinseyi]XP_033215669.1 piwi-like protein Siwi [Belonocnema kinseyi]